MIKRRKVALADAELDITSFMNLMIVLVPVLLLSLVFAQIRVLNIQLPPLTEQQLQQEQQQPQQLELDIHPDRLRLNYPAGEPLRGREEIAASYRVRPRSRMTRHICTNMLVHVDSDEPFRILDRVPLGA